MTVRAAAGRIATREPDPGERRWLKPREGRPRVQVREFGSPPRVVLYSHDTYGLGHLRRSLRLAGHLAASPRNAAVLVITGSPRTQAFDLPPGCDTLKLPAVLKQSNGGYRSRSLPIALEEAVTLRGEIIRHAVRAFGPDLVIVDHAPAGMTGELRPLFADIAGDPRTRLVLGLRDIIDDASRVRDDWNRQQIWRLIDDVYDLVLVYGDPDVVTTASELGLERRYPGKVQHVGYVAAHSTTPHRVATERPHLLVTVGGGGDGQHLLRSYVRYLEGLREKTSFQSIIITGPFFSERRYREIEGRLRRLNQPVTLQRFTDGAEQLVADALGVISMAGYNTVVDLLAAGTPALLVPRETPRLEQRIRAERLAARGAVEYCAARDLGAARIAGFVRAVQQHEKRCRVALRLDGLDRAVDAVFRLLGNAGDDATTMGVASHATSSR